MRQIYFATTNKGKVYRVANILSKFNIEVIQKPIEIPELKSESPGQIASQKVLYAFEHIKKPVIALDAGFYIHSLGGFPQTNVNFALKTIGVNGILKLVEGQDRECEFRHCLAFFDETLKEPLIFEGLVKGKLSGNEAGARQDYFWSDLFFVFIPEGKSQTLAEMTPEEYFAWSEELNASSYLTKFGEWFSNRDS